MTGVVVITLRPGIVHPEEKHLHNESGRKYLKIFQPRETVFLIKKLQGFSTG
jgi:hypothetical protein